MASTYTTNKVIEKPGNGDYVNTWNVPVNDDFDIIDASLGGTTTLNATGASGTTTLSATQYRPPTIIVTGVLTASVTYRIPSGKGGQWVIFNNTSGAFNVTFDSGGGGTSVITPQGQKVLIYSDGTNVALGVTVTTTTAGGSSGQVQYNSGGSLAGSSNLTYDGTGNLVLGATLVGRLDVRNAFRIYGATSGYVGWTVPAAAGSTTYTLPNADGTSGQTLTTNGSGTLSWATPGAITAVNTFSAGTTGFTPSTATSGAVTLAGTLSVSNGGTGITTTPTNGQIPIGNGSTYTAATLTAGAGVVITNGSGSVQLTATAATGLPSFLIVTGTTVSAVSGMHYALTNAATSTVTLSASPSAGDLVWVTAANGLETNIIDPNGGKIQGQTTNYVMYIAFSSLQFRYINTTIGWAVIGWGPVTTGAQDYILESYGIV
jgi:hypothetical protein